MANGLKIFTVLVLCVNNFAGLYAAEILRNETVESRARPDYDPRGLRLGSFNLVSKVSVDYAQDDNIRATENVKLDDSILIIAPEIELKSDWGKHELAAGVRVVDASYDEYSNEDYTDYRYWGDGKFEFGRSELIARASHSKLHELRTSANDEAGLEPTEYTLDRASLRYRYRPNRYFFDVLLKFATVDFDDTVNLPPPIGPGGKTNNDDRDRDKIDARFRFGYQVSPGYSLFAESRLYDIDYDSHVDRDGENRDSDGYDLLVGTELDISSVMFGEFFFGYRSFDYEDAAFETQDGFTYGADIDWNITRLTTFNFVASQKILGTIVQNASGIETTELKFHVDHELRRNILLNLTVDYRNEDFLQIVREDDYWRLRVGAEYFLNRNWSLNGGYIYQKRDSNLNNVIEYTINQLYIGFSAQI
jgi:hypothetical protein